jgi:hypothetical protein
MPPRPDVEVNSSLPHGIDSEEVGASNDSQYQNCKNNRDTDTSMDDTADVEDDMNIATNHHQRRLTEKCCQHPRYRFCGPDRPKPVRPPSVLSNRRLLRLFVHLGYVLQVGHGVFINIFCGGSKVDKHVECSRLIYSLHNLLQKMHARRYVIPSKPAQRRQCQSHRDVEMHLASPCIA